MNIILFGPPGIGKSTIIGELKTRGLRAVDLEDIDSRLRYQLPNVCDGVVFGGADLNPKRQYPNTKKVLLIADQYIYDRRRARRDAKQPSKAEQPAHSVEQWEPDSKMWDYVIKTNSAGSSDTPSRTAYRVQAIMEEVSSKKGG